MEKSQFQFSNPRLKSIQFITHDEFVKQGKLNMSIKIATEQKRAENADGSLANSALVAVTVSVGEKDNSTPFYIEAVQEADFKWNERELDEQQIEVLLSQNAVALLISYLRPIISSLTAASPYPVYNLPYINLAKEK